MKKVRSRYKLWQTLKDKSFAEYMMQEKSMQKKEEEERREITGLLGDLSGKTVLDIGAGVGRFTREFAQKARKVIAVDLLEHSLEKNSEYNKNFTNIEYICSDALDLSFPNNSCDLIFSSWLLMYIQEHEILKLLENCGIWLTRGGRIFFKESCNTNVLGYSIFKTGLIGLFQKITGIIIDNRVIGAPTFKDIRNWIKGNAEQSVYYRKPGVYEDIFKKYFHIQKSGFIKVFKQLYNSLTLCGGAGVAKRDRLKAFEC